MMLVQPVAPLANHTQASLEMDYCCQLGAKQCKLIDIIVRMAFDCQGIGVEERELIGIRGNGPPNDVALEFKAERRLLF